MGPLRSICASFVGQLAAALLLLGLAVSHQPAAAQQTVSTVQIALPDTVSPQSGRLLLFFASSPEPEPRFGPSIFNPEPVYGIDLNHRAPDAPVRFAPGRFSEPTALAFPKPLEDLAPGTYYVQALLDRDTTQRSYAQGEGNLYSAVEKIDFAPKSDGALTVSLNQTVTTEKPADTQWVKLVDIKSEQLSSFHNEEVHLRAGVILPPNYADEPDRQYPTVYVIPGFGGRHTNAWSWIESPEGKAWKQGNWPMPMIRVVLDPDTPLGHSTFANSANNGPVGDALVEELIPAIEQQFRTVSQPHGRFLRGHSSGGWASLWLQITYPEFFGGTWSTAPDPVDFRAFQVLNIYKAANAYYTDSGYPYPSVRNHGNIVLSIRDENRIEYVTGPGGQWDSWHAVFGPRSAEGHPMPLWHKLTGRINPEVAEYWKQYDIRRILENNWSSLGPKLKGKLHIVGGAEDNFYLENALYLLKDFLVTTDYNGYLEVLPGDHGSFVNAQLRQRFYQEMKTQYQTYNADSSPAR